MEIEARKILEDSGYDISDHTGLKYILIDIQNNRRAFTEEEFSTDEYNRRLNAVFSLLNENQNIS